MSQNISIIGSHSPVTDDSSSIQVREHSAEKMAQEALSDAPPLMTDEMDKAREMTHIPERDLSEEVLARRNEETGETVAGRALASALEKDDGPAMREASRQLQGRARTAQMENMLEQARLCGTASAMAENGSVALDEVNRSEDVSSAEKTQAEKPVEEGPAVRERTVSEEVFDILQDFRPGMLCSKDMTLAQMQEEEARVDALIENFSAEEAEDSSHTIVLAQLVKYQIQLSNSMTCRTNLEAALATLERINGEEGSPARKLEALVECELLWQNGMELKNALGKLEEGDPQQMLDALRDRGIGIVGKDLDVLEDAVVDAVTRQLGLLQAENGSPLSSDSLAALARLSLRAGENPARMLDILNKGLSWASGAEYKDALISALVSGAAATNTPEGRRSPAQRSETLRYVDMVFQGAYPEYADEALALLVIVKQTVHNAALHEMLVHNLAGVLRLDLHVEGVFRKNLHNRALLAEAQAARTDQLDILGQTRHLRLRRLNLLAELFGNLIRAAGVASRAAANQNILFESHRNVLPRPAHEALPRPCGPERASQEFRPRRLRSHARRARVPCPRRRLPPSVPDPRDPWLRFAGP